MLILASMLVIALLGAAWGFLACFLPAKWDRLNEAISFANHWTEASPKRLHPIIKFGNRTVGFVIFSVGSWFSYVAVSEMYLVLTGQSTVHSVVRSNSSLPNSPSPILTAFSVFMIIIGLLMIVFPAKAMMLVEHVWPTGRSISRSATPKIALLVRLFGAVLTFMAIMSLIH